MKRFHLVFFICLVLVFIVNHPVQAAVNVPRAVICTKVVDREPVGAAERFPAGTRRLYFFSEVRGAQDNTVIKHLWFRNDRLVLEVELTVNGPRWRTWSHKNFHGNTTGTWHAEVVDSQGKVLDSVPFTFE